MKYRFSYKGLQQNIHLVTQPLEEGQTVVDAFKSATSRITETHVAPWREGTEVSGGVLRGGGAWEATWTTVMNYKDTKAKCRHLKKLTCKGILLQVFIRVYRLEIQSVMLVFRPLPPSNLFSGSTLPPSPPSLCE